MSIKIFHGTLPPELADGLRACRKHLMFAAVFSALLNLLFLAPTLYMMQDSVIRTSNSRA